MGDDEVLGLLEEIYADVRGVRRDLRPEDRLREDLALDSLAAAELLTALEDALAVSLVDDERLGDVQTVADVLAIVSSAPPLRRV